MTPLMEKILGVLEQVENPFMSAIEIAEELNKQGGRFSAGSIGGPLGVLRCQRKIKCRNFEDYSRPIVRYFAYGKRQVHHPYVKFWFLPARKKEAGEKRIAKIKQLVEHSKGPQNGTP